MSDFDNSADFERLPGVAWENWLPHMRGDFDPRGTSADRTAQQRQQFQNGANMDAPTPNLPYRLAHQIQEAILQLAEVNDYTMGLAERQDLAIDIANDWFNRQTFEPADLAFEGLNQWRRIWGREES